MADTDALRIEVTDRIVLVTINRPERRNAINDVVRQGLVEVAQWVDADDDLQGMILTGTGTAAFCAGADLHELAERLDRDRVAGPSFFRLRRAKPAIAAVNGAAVGGGFELVLACDLAIAAHSATFAMPEVLRGQVPGGGGVFRLAQLVGIRRATELLLTGAKIGAARAAELGIVNEVVPDDTLLDRAKALAQQITRGGPLAVAGVLDSVRQPFDGSEESWWRRADELSTAIRGSADAEEGARAFVEKRAPVWTGRAQR